MKSIWSNGGPLVGLNHGLAHLWSGIEGKDFVGEGSSFATDYEAACDLVVGINHPPCNIAKLVGNLAEALLITMPVETANVSSDHKSILVAQVEAAEPDWAFSRLSLSDFERASLERNFTLKLERGLFVIFDATYRFEDVRENYLGSGPIEGIPVGSAI